MKTVTVRAAYSQEETDRLGYCVEQECETVKDAKKRAKYYLTEEYMNVAESTTRLTYAQVLVNGEVRHDYFA